MLYNAQNARGAGKPLAKVLEVNPRAGWVKVHQQPLRLDVQG